MEKRRVVITGMGAVTPLGLTLTDSWAAAKRGECGVGPITLYDSAGQKVSLAAEVKNFDPAAFLDKKEARKLDRCVQFALSAADQAVASSGLQMEQEDAGGEEEEMAMAMGRDSRRDMGLRDLIGVLLFNEMYRRRCRHRKCRRFY